MEDQELAFRHIMFEMLVDLQVSCPGGSWTSRSSASESSFGWRGRLRGLRPLASQIKSLRESVQCEKASGEGWSAEKCIQGPTDGGGHAEGRGPGDSLRGRDQRGRGVVHGVLGVDRVRGSRRRERSEHQTHQGLIRQGSSASGCGTQRSLVSSAETVSMEQQGWARWQ